MIGKSGLGRLRFSHESEHMAVGNKCKYILCLLTLIRQNYLVSKHELVSVIGYQSVSTMGYELAGQNSRDGGHASHLPKHTPHFPKLIYLLLQPNIQGVSNRVQG